MNKIFIISLLFLGLANPVLAAKHVIELTDEQEVAYASKVGNVDTAILDLVLREVDSAIVVAQTKASIASMAGQWQQLNDNQKNTICTALGLSALDCPK